MRKQLTLAGFTAGLQVGSAAAWACDRCRPMVQSGVYNADFIGTFSLLMLPLLALLVLAIAAHYMDDIGNSVDAKGSKS